MQIGRGFPIAWHIVFWKPYPWVKNLMLMQVREFAYNNTKPLCRIAWHLWTNTKYPGEVSLIISVDINRKAILKLQDQLSQHDWCKNLNQRHLRYVRWFKSTNQRIRTKQTSLSGAGLWFWTANGRDTLIDGFESTCMPQMPLVEIFAAVMLRKLVLQLEDWAHIRMGHGYIP